MNALEHETVWQEMYRRSLDFARKGTFMAGLSAIDIALWDIKGQLISKCPFGVIVWTKIPTNVFPRFLP